MTLREGDALAVEVAEAIRGGEVERVRALLAEHAGLARARIVDPKGHGRSLLHVVTDWPGHFPRAAEVVRALAEAGADLNAHFEGGRHRETPLHWAASSDDVEVLDALLDVGANIEERGSVFDEGTALADAVAFGQWRAARRLAERGARANLWQAAGLGLLDRTVELVSFELTRAFWSACFGGQRKTAEYLLERGAELNWVGYDGMTPLDAAVRSGAPELVEWLRDRGAVSAKL